jgi:D-tyrosyl-tRNA(Tyr) deacylase
MLAVVQRVSQAQVAVADKIVGRIGLGFVVLLGVMRHDTEADLNYLVKKVSQLRIIADQQGKMNLALKDVSGEVLVVSQFTLAGSVAKGNRPSFINAAEPAIGEKFYQQFIAKLKANGLTVKTGKFGAYMQLKLTNDGPTTIIIDSHRK